MGGSGDSVYRRNGNERRGGVREGSKTSDAKRRGGGHMREGSSHAGKAVRQGRGLMRGAVGGRPQAAARLQTNCETASGTHGRALANKKK